MRYNIGLALDALGVATSYANFFCSIALTSPIVRIYFELRPERPSATASAGRTGPSCENQRFVPSTGLACGQGGSGGGPAD